MNTLPPTVELQQIHLVLARLEADRARLLARREQLLAELNRGAGTVAGTPAPPGVRPAWQSPPTTRRETNPPTVQNVLLGLGGVLLAVAVTAFTVVSWGHLGTAGRAVILALLTLTAMTAPALLLRRALTATAEVVGCLGLVLLMLDAYALHLLAFPHAGWAGYGAAASTALALIWSGYGLWLRRPSSTVGAGSPAAESADAGPRPASANGLRLPLPLALGLAQLPLSLWAFAVSADAFGHTWALIGTAALDVLVARCRPAPGLRVTAAVSAAVTGCPGAGFALGLSLSAAGAGDAARAAAVLLAVSAGALAAALLPAGPATAPDPAGRAGTALRRPEVWWAALAGAAAVAAAGGLLRTVVPAHWAVTGYAVCATALLLAARLAAGRRNLSSGLYVAGVAVHAAALLWALPFVAVAVAGPLGWAGAVWSGAPGGAAAAVAPDLRWPGTAAVPVVPALSAVVALAVHRRAGAGRWGRTAACAAVASSCAAVAVLPVALDLALPVALLLLVALTAVLLLASTTLPSAPAAMTACLCAAGVALGTACWSLAEEPLTSAVLGALLLAFAAAAAAPGGGRVQPVTASAAAVCAGGLAAAAAVSLGLPGDLVAFAVLPAGTVVAVAAAHLRGRPAAFPLECTGYAVTAVAVVTAAGDAAVLATALALAGVIAAGTALRPDRRRAAGLAATALFVSAAWVRLAASGVETPEAYTLPVTIPALAVGLLRQRRDPQTSSWRTYGPGLAATLLPSLVAAWADAHWTRPLVLGPAALAVTLAGARWRLQAPLLLGGAVVALVAVHELAPFIVQVVDGLPRWLPPALAGVLLLTLGTTYEQRLRDARRIREALSRLR